MVNMASRGWRIGAAALAAPAAFATQPVIATRVWPAEEYTRVTFETAADRS